MAKAAKKSAQKSATKKTPKTKQKAAKKTPKKIIAAKPAKTALKKPLKKAAPKAAKKAKAPAKALKPIKAAKAAKKPAVKAVTIKAAPAAVKASAKVKTADYSQVFSPLDDRVLVLKVGFSNRTPGGLYIPDTVSGDDRPSQGTVVAVGPGHRDKKGRLRPLDVKIGDTVMFKAFTGSDVKIDASELLCLRESEIIAIVK